MTGRRWSLSRPHIGPICGAMLRDRTRPVRTVAWPFRRRSLVAARGAGAAVGPGAADRCAGRTLIGAQQDCVLRSLFALAFFDLDLLLLLRDLRWLW